MKGHEVFRVRESNVRENICKKIGREAASQQAQSVDSVKGEELMRRTAFDYTVFNTGA